MSVPSWFITGSIVIDKTHNGYVIRPDGSAYDPANCLSFDSEAAFDYYLQANMPAPPA